jgi:periplasmic divalent cation tolerance protein
VGHIAVYTTVASREEADALGEVLVRERLVACASAFAVSSVYRWQGEVEKANEWALVLKAREEDFDRIERRIRQLHRYELPAIVAYRVAAGSPDYLRWIDESCSRPG